jgi:hypothetical protein
MLTLNACSHHPNALAHTVGEYADIIFGSGGAAGSPGRRTSTRTSTSTDAGDDVIESHDVRPCYLRGQPATGKSMLIESVCWCMLAYADVC